METEFSISSVIYKLSISALFIYIGQLIFYKSVVRSEMDKVTDDNIDLVVKEVSKHYKEQLRMENVNEEQFHRKLFEMLVILSNEKNAKRKTFNYGYWLIVFFSLSILFISRRNSNEFNSNSSNLSDILLSVLAVTFVSLLFQYSFYTHFVKGYRINIAHETILHLLKHKYNTYNLPPGINCSR